MITFLKRLLCRHEYENTGVVHYEKHKGFIILKNRYRCRKCGKVVYK